MQNNDIFILSSDGNLRKYTLVPVKKAIDKACARKIYELGYQIVTIYDKRLVFQKKFSKDILSKKRPSLEP